MSASLHLVLFPDVGAMWPAAHTPASVTPLEWYWTSFSICKGERASDQKIHMIISITITSHSCFLVTACLSMPLRTQSAEAGRRAYGTLPLPVCAGARRSLLLGNTDEISCTTQIQWGAQEPSASISWQSEPLSLVRCTWEGTLCCLRWPHTKWKHQMGLRQGDVVCLIGKQNWELRRSPSTRFSGYPGPFCNLGLSTPWFSP